MCHCLSTECSFIKWLYKRIGFCLFRLTVLIDPRQKRRHWCVYGRIGCGQTGCVSPGDDANQLGSSTAGLRDQGAATVSVAGSVGFSGGVGAYIGFCQRIGGWQRRLAFVVVNNDSVQFLKVQRQQSWVVAAPAVQISIASALECLWRKTYCGNRIAAITGNGIQVKGILFLEEN